MLRHMGAVTYLSIGVEIFDSGTWRSGNVCANPDLQLMFILERPISLAVFIKERL